VLNLLLCWKSYVLVCNWVCSVLYWIFILVLKLLIKWSIVVCLVVFMYVVVIIWSGVLCWWRMVRWFLKRCRLYYLMNVMMMLMWLVFASSVFILCLRFGLLGLLVRSVVLERGVEGWLFVMCYVFLGVVVGIIVSSCVVEGRVFWLVLRFLMSWLIRVSWCLLLCSLWSTRRMMLCMCCVRILGVFVLLIVLCSILWLVIVVSCFLSVFVMRFLYKFSSRLLFFCVMLWSLLFVVCGMMWLLCSIWELVIEGWLGL